MIAALRSSADNRDTLPSKAPASAEDAMLDPKGSSGNQPGGRPAGFPKSATLLLLFVTAYVAAVMLGLPKDRRIDPATLGVIGIGAIIAMVLFRPDIVDRITRLEIAGWRVEIEKRQDKQDKQLDDIQLILPILLAESERKHLLNLAAHNTQYYKGNQDTRTELRRLRYLKLIKMKSGQEIRHIEDSKVVDLSNFVELTELGQHWADRIKEIESEAAKAADSSMQPATN